MAVRFSGKYHLVACHSYDIKLGGSNAAPGVLSKI